MTKHLMSHLQAAMIPIGIAVGVIGFWSFSVWGLGVPRWLVAPPSAVFLSLFENPIFYLRSVAFTSLAAISGLGAAIIFGLAMGACLSLSKAFRMIAEPIIVALKSFPMVALAPIITIVFGYGLASKVVVAALLSWLPCVFGTMRGLSMVPQPARIYAQSVGFRRWQEYLYLRFPYAVPHIATGIKTAAPLSVVGAVVGEFAGSSGLGLGYIILTAGNEIATERIYAALIILGCLGALLYRVAALAERAALSFFRLPPVD